MNEVLTELLEKRDKAQTDLEAHRKPVIDAKRDMTDDEALKDAELRGNIDKLDTRLDEVVAEEQRNAKLNEARKIAGLNKDTSTDMKVTNERSVYGEGSSHSYYVDLARKSLPGHQQHDAAVARMAQWGHQVAREAHLDTKTGRSALTQLREATREDGQLEQRNAMENFRDYGNAEFRAPLATGGGSTATSGGSFGAFVAPVFQDYIPFRQAGRSFADAVHRETLPEYGMVIQAPAVTAAAGIASQTEGSGVQETDPTAGFVNATVITEAGQVTISQQLLDRAGPGYGMDRIINDQLDRALAPKVDAYVLAQALASANAVAMTNATFIPVGTSGITGASAAPTLYQKVGLAKLNINTTNGIFLRPNAIFMQPGRWEVLAAWGDANSRPIVLPDTLGAYQAVAGGAETLDTGIEGPTGFLFAGLPVFKDVNIPTPGTGNDQVLVLDTDVVVLWEGAPVSRAVPQTLAGNLQVLIQKYEYLAAFSMYGAAVQALSGTGFTAYGL